jgi:Ca-activated chloride channel family protein
MSFDSITWLGVLAVAVPLLVLFYVITERGAWKRLSQFAGSEILQQLTDSYSPFLRNMKAFLIILVVVLGCLALARPQLGHTYREEKRRGIDFIIALDVSRSMLAEDIKPNRLQRAKFAILDLLDKTEGDRVALLAFAGSAFLQCPLTLDYDAFRQTLDSVDTGLLATQGTDIAGAILEAQGSFAEDENQKILVMISDGEDLEAEGVLQARKAGEAGITIYTVGVGSSDGELIPFTPKGGVRDWLRDPQGELVRTKLDETALRQIAVATNGAYVPLGASGQGLNYVYEHGLSLVPEEDREAHLRKLPTERYQWPLAFAVCCLLVEMLLGTRRMARSGVAVAGAGTRLAVLAMLALLGLTPGTVDAYTFGGGKSLYKKGKYKEAREHFQKEVGKVPDSAVNHYNLGAAHLRTGEYDSAVESLSKALELEREDPEFQSDVYESRGFVRFHHGEAALREDDPARAVELWTQGVLDYGSALSLHEKQDERYGELQRNLRLFQGKIQDLSYRNGVQHYRDGEFTASIEAFNEVLKEADKANRDEVLYNLANSRFRLGEQQLKENPKKTVENWEQALKDYASAIEARDDSSFVKAEKNQEIVRKRLEALKEQMQQNPEQNQDNKDDQDSQNKEDKNKAKSQQNQDSKEKNKDNPSKSKEDQNKEQASSKGEDSKEKGEPEKAKPRDGQEEKAGKAGEQKEGEKPESGQQTQAIPGRMTQEQAMQLLEQLRGFERKLPLGNLENIRRKDRNDGREGRNW